MKLTATYAWSALVEVEVPDDATPEQQLDALDNAAVDAADNLDFKHPVMTECSNEELLNL